MFQNKYVPLIGQNFHFHDGWRNLYTYGPGHVLVLGNEAHGPLERAKPRRLPIFIPRRTHQELLLDQVSRKRDSWWSMTYPMGSCSYTYEGAIEARNLALVLLSTLGCSTLPQVMSSTDSTSEIILSNVLVTIIYCG